MATLDLVLVLVVAVVVSSWLGRLLPLVATPLIQIALGAAMGRLGVDAVRIDPELFFVLFLPPLLFLDGWRFSGRELLQRAGPIAALAIGLVLVTVLVVGPALAALTPQLPLVAALTLVAVLSPTDAIAGIELLRAVPLSRRIVRIVEGEALLNDASALICLHVVLLLGSAAAPSGASLVAQLAWTGGGGLAIGAGVGMGLLGLKNAVSARLGETTATQILISLLLPYAAYHAAVALGASGILAPVAAGMVMGRLELSGTALPLTRLRRTAIWETLEFTLNGVIFVLLGEQLPRIVARAAAELPKDGVAGPWSIALVTLVAWAALTLIRFAFVTAMTLWHDRRQPPDARMRVRLLTVLAMTFSGVRGAVTLAAALALPIVLPDGADFPARNLVIAAAAGVILTSLIVANVALPVIARLIAAASADGDDGALRQARLRAAQAAMAAVERANQEREGTAIPSQREAVAGDEAQWDQAAATILSAYRARLERLGAPAGTGIRREAAEHQLRVAALHAERAEVAAMVAEHMIDDETARLLLRELDSQEAALAI